VTQEHNVDLAPYTTFGVHAIAPLVTTVTTLDELRHAVQQHPGALILGGGSNVLASGTLKKSVIRIAIRGRDVEEHDNSVLITAGAGENWHGMVTWCVENNWGGLENLALIPGTVGAAPIQNIGAYGIEQRTCFSKLQAVNKHTLEVHDLTADDCAFGYRDSSFKQHLRDDYVIANVTYKLSKSPHDVHASYKDVAAELSQENSEPTIQDVYDAVVRIRTRKLPDPKVVGNAGSFFKNPVIATEHLETLQVKYPEIPHYPNAQQGVKVPAAWLIDTAGWKGHKDGTVGVHDRQALVLINLGDANGSDVLALADKIKASVFERFGITLEREVNVW